MRAIASIIAALGLVVITSGAAEAVPNHYVYIDETVTCSAGLNKLAVATGNTIPFSTWISTRNPSSTVSIFRFKVQLIKNQTATYERRCYDSYAPYTVRKSWPGDIAVTYNPDGKLYTVS